MEKTPPSTDQAAEPATRVKRSFIMKRALTPGRRRTRRASIAVAGVGLVIVAALAVPRRIPHPAAGAPAVGTPATTPAADLAPVAASGVTVEVTAPAPVATAPGAAPHSAVAPSKSASASKVVTTR